MVNNGFTSFGPRPMIINALGQNVGVYPKSNQNKMFKCPPYSTQVREIMCDQKENDRRIATGLIGPGYICRQLREFRRVEENMSDGGVIFKVSSVFSFFSCVYFKSKTC